MNLPNVRETMNRVIGAAHTPLIQADWGDMGETVIHLLMEELDLYAHKNGRYANRLDVEDKHVHRVIVALGELFKKTYQAGEDSRDQYLIHEFTNLLRRT